MHDKNLDCKDCGVAFVFSIRDQHFYREKGFENDPQRCRDCRTKRKTSRNGVGGRKLHDAVCAACGLATQVPFTPRGDRPIYCKPCFDRIAQETPEAPAVSS